jgi:hypothetical protein
MTNSEYRSLIGKLIERTSARADAKVLSDAFELVKSYDEQVRLDVFDAGGAQVQMAELNGEAADAHQYSARIRRLAEGMLADGRSEYVSTLLDIVQETLFFDAPYDFDAFCRYIESEREDDKQFYMPRRKQLYVLTKSLQDLEMRRIRRLCISLPPGVGKSTLAIFYMCWTSGRHPELQSIIGSHNIEFVRGVS